jgi:Signal transduction histidine kinase
MPYAAGLGTRGPAIDSWRTQERAGRAKEQSIATKQVISDGEADSTGALRPSGVCDVSSQPWTRPLSGRGLRVVGILLPIAGVVLLELARHVFEARGYSSARLMEAWHVAMLVLVVGAIVGFGLFMFRLIDASERQILTQNRDLTTANAVAAAMQGQSTVSGVIDGALDAVVRTAGATRARILLSDPDGASGRDEATYTSVAPGAMRDAGGPSLDVPLAHGGTPVGRLSVWYAEEPAVRERLGSTVLSSLTTQIACAIQLARAVEDLNRRKREGHALYDILLRVSNQDPLTPVLDAVAQHARTRLGAAGASITINPATASSVRFESGPQGPALLRDGTVVITSGTAQEQHAAHAASELVTGAAGPLGGIRVVRASGTFSDRDRGFLSTLASLVGIALTGAQLREASRQRAILDERTRIAREMHDGLAQVLGAAHLRLRALSASLATLPEDEVAAEIDALAEVCAESYGDVREAILGLRDADRHAKRSLEDNLRAYLSTYSAQAGIASTLLNEVGHEVSLSPRAEVHLIRVVQEALTNVRKHASATSVTVSISGTHSTTSFVIADDGVGFDPAATEGSQDGYGLFTMRDRAALLGGTVEIDSVIGGGTRITVTVPERPVARASGL